MYKQKIFITLITVLIIIGLSTAKTGNTIIGDSITNILNVSAEQGDFITLYHAGERVTNFWINITGQPKINESVTWIAGDNIALSQDTTNKTITVKTNISGGGVSFDGSTVDLNGSSLRNGTFSNLNDTKVNKSGDNLSYVLNLSYINSNDSIVFNQTLRTFHLNVPNKYINSTGADISDGVNSNGNLYTLMFQNRHPNIIYNLISFRSIANGSFPYFLGQAARGTIDSNGTAYPTFLNNNDIIFRFSVSGWDDSVNGFSGSRAAMDVLADGNWNKTSNPTKIVFKTNSVGNATMFERLTIWGNGTIQINSLAGVPGFVCNDVNGKLYSKTGGCP